MEIGYIYKITNKINQKIYIGQTSKTLEQRWREHKYDCKKGKTYPLYSPDICPHIPVSLRLLYILFL